MFTWPAFWESLSPWVLLRDSSEKWTVFTPSDQKAVTHSAAAPVTHWYSCSWICESSSSPSPRFLPPRDLAGSGVSTRLGCDVQMDHRQKKPFPLPLPWGSSFCFHLDYSRKAEAGGLLFIVHVWVHLWLHAHNHSLPEGHTTNMFLYLRLFDIRFLSLAVQKLSKFTRVLYSSAVLKHLVLRLLQFKVKVSKFAH